MPTVLQIISSLGVAAVIAAITYIIRLEKRISGLESIKVQVGEKDIPKQGAEDFWDAKHGGGWRKTSVPIKFGEPFRRQPVVMVALKRFDLGDFKSNIHRIGVRADKVDQTGFELYFETWHESLVFEATVSWIAVTQ